MARVTVEDCVAVVPNRYELVLLAAQRSRDIAAGSQLTVDRDNDKNTVVALREIAEQSISFEQLKNHISKGVNRLSDLNVEDDVLLAMAQENSAGVETGDSFDAGSFEEVNFEDTSVAAPVEETSEADDASESEAA